MESVINNVEYLGCEIKTSRAGKNFTVLTLADPVKYEKLEFFISDNFVIPNGIHIRNKVSAIVDIQKDRKGTSIWLREISLSKAV